MTSLEHELTQFIGTTCYHRFGSMLGSLMTDGAYFLAEHAQCYWLFDALDSHLVGKAQREEYFAVSTLTVDTEERDGVLLITDGNGNTFARQKLEYTDFPLREIKLYSSFDGVRWIHMLTSEY